METLFYSVNDKKLFHIPNYYTHGTGMLKYLQENLKEGEQILRKFVKTGDIYCDEIKESRRYKGMWYFSVHCETPPAEAFQLSKDWTMFQWLRN